MSSEQTTAGADRSPRSGTVACGPRSVGAPGAAQVQAVWLSERPAQPWRNGGGVTRELLTWPLAAADWQLRLSVADIDADGPFSAFDGVQRVFVVLQGAGVWLGEGTSARRLTTADAPWAFAGEDAPACRLIDGPTRDLNLMLRREAGTAQVQAVQPGQAQAEPDAAWRGLFCADACWLTVAGQAPLKVPAMSLWWREADPSDWSVQPQALGEAAPRAWWLSLRRHPARPPSAGPQAPRPSPSVAPTARP